ncbi:MAG: hypothetical protein RBR40_08365 [Tenuifilaceae bacterium]|nr:hypothetical protein [Tenuifilaceae bacterium]
MRKQLMTALIERLKHIEKDEAGNYVVATEPNPDKTVIQHFDLWNQQLDWLDEEQPFTTPAVFIEFLPIQWRHQSRGTRDATLSINLHIVTRRNIPTRADQQYTTEALGFLELLDAVNLCLHGHKGENFSALTGQTSTTDNNFDELMHSIEQYTAYIVDHSGSMPQNKVAAGLIVEI